MVICSREKIQLSHSRLNKLIYSGLQDQPDTYFIKLNPSLSRFIGVISFTSRLLNYKLTELAI